VPASLSLSSRRVDRLVSICYDLCSLVELGLSPNLHLLVGGLGGVEVNAHVLDIRSSCQL